MPSILYCNTIDYDMELQQRPHHIMNILAKRGWKVYWVNSTKIEGKAKDVINENLEVWHNWDVFKKRVPEVDVFFASWSHCHKYIGDVKSKIVVYDSLDNFEANESQEKFMIEKADILLTTSSPLYELRKNEHNNVHICRNACFPELGEKAYPIPKDLLPIKQNGKPIILFSGALSSSWCDLELVQKIEKEYQLVFVGKTWGINKLSKNIIHLGSKKYDELQAYYQHCDVNILPFKRCQIADFSNPIKNYEAMCHGKITVATDIPEATVYPNIVLPSKNHNEFMDNIKKAIKMSKDLDVISLCKKYAQENSWYTRVDLIEQEINKLLKF